MAAELRLVARPGEADVSVWSTKIHPETINELRWYFQSGPAALGYRSQFGAVVSRIYGQNKIAAAPVGDSEEPHERATRSLAHTIDDNGDDPEDAMIRRLDDTAKHRRIHHGLGALTTSQYRALEAIYESRDWPNALLQTFGELAGLAVISESARDAYNHASNTHARGVRWWLNEHCRHDGASSGLVKDIAKEIGEVALDAHQAYSANREQVRR